MAGSLYKSKEATTVQMSLQSSLKFPRDVINYLILLLLLPTTLSWLFVNSKEKNMFLFKRT